MDDWLDSGGTSVSPEQKAAGLEVARMYHECFVMSPAGSKLLQMWTERDFNEPVPVDASINRYAAVEARRAFIRGIHRQIPLAKTGGV